MKNFVLFSVLTLESVVIILTFIKFLNPKKGVSHEGKW
jgi:hypothetical protein